jgi:hypothetical protein
MRDEKWGRKSYRDLTMKKAMSGESRVKVATGITGLRGLRGL